MAPNILEGLGTWAMLAMKQNTPNRNKMKLSKLNLRLIASSATVEIAPMATRFSWPGLKTKPWTNSKLKIHKQSNILLAMIKVHIKSFKMNDG